MTKFQAHMKQALGGGKLKGKSKTERAAAFKAAVASWKGARRAGSSSPSRKAPKRRATPAQARARKAFVKMARSRNVQRKSGAGRRVRRRGLDRQSQRGRGMGFGRVPAPAVRNSLTLATPGYFPAANPSSPRAHGDVHGFPSPSLNGDTYNGQPILPRVADGVRIDIRSHEAALIRR